MRESSCSLPSLWGSRISGTGGSRISGTISLATEEPRVDEVNLEAVDREFRNRDPHQNDLREKVLLHRFFTVLERAELRAEHHPAERDQVHAAFGGVGIILADSELQLL